jgi:hypothetical protein
MTIRFIIRLHSDRGCGFLRLWCTGPGISWTNHRPYFSERMGNNLPFARAFGYRFFWLGSI